MPDPKGCPQWTGVKVDAVADWSCLVSIGFTGAYHLSISTIRHMSCMCMYDVYWFNWYRVSEKSHWYVQLQTWFRIWWFKTTWTLSRFYASDLLGPWGTSAGALFIISPEISMPTFAAANCSIFQSLMFQKQQYTKYTLVLFEFMSFDENERVTLGWAWSTKFTKWQIKSSFEDIWLLSAMRTARSRASICQSAAWKCTVMNLIFIGDIK